MPDDNKTQEFLQKLAPCIERGDLDACVEEAARVAREMGVGAQELLSLFIKKEMDPKLGYVIILVSAQRLVGKDKVDAYFSAAQLASDLDWKDKEEENYKKALEVDPRNKIAHNNYASLLIELGRKEEAEQHYLRAIEADQNEAYLHYNYAILLKQLGRVKEAEEHYEKAIELDKKFVGAYINYANLLRENARYYEAENEVRIALQIEPKNPVVLGIYGDILADEDYLEEAIEKYHEAIKNSDSMAVPAKAEIHNNLGWVYVHLEKYNRAKKEFEEAHKLDPQNVKVIRNVRALRKVKSEPKISNIQWCIAILLFSGVIATWYLFWTEMLTENVFAAQFIILIAMLVFILFYHQLGKFKAGPIEFEKSTEHRSQPSETIEKIER